MRIPGMLTALLALLLGVVPAAHARPRARAAEPPVLEAPPNALPAGGTPETLVEAARQLPAAQLAMQQMVLAGYTRAPAADLAKLEAGHAFVSLAFIDPTHPARAPLVLVNSDLTTVPARTWVAGAVVDVDVATGRVEIANDAPEGAWCIVTVTDPASTRPENYVVSTGKLARQIKEWLGCTMLGCTAGAAVCATVGMLVGPLAPPAIGGCIIAACAIMAYACLW